MAFRRSPKQPDPDHPEPVEIDLGRMQPWQVDAVLADMQTRYRLRSYDLSSLRFAGGTDRHYRLVVHADDAEAVRQELIEAELLEG